MMLFGTLLDRIEDTLGDPSGTTWARTTTIWQWACDALREFPILRPMQLSKTITVAGNSFALPSDFRRIIRAEFPVSQDPPVYLTRKAHTDADFFYADGYYDVEPDYATGSGYLFWSSEDLAIGDVLKVYYLAGHTATFTSELASITVEDEHVNVIINHVIWLAFQERLAIQLQDPTAHTSTIQQMAAAVKVAEDNYQRALAAAIGELNSSKIVQGYAMDKFDRIY